MSTVPDRRIKKAADGPLAAAAKKSAAASVASFDYGYRLKRKKRSDGTIELVEVPLTLEDVLHPKFGDVHMLTDAHGVDCAYLRTVLRDRYIDDPSVVVLSDTGVFWDVPGLKHHSPDLSLIFGVKARKEWRVFEVKREKVRPALIIEVTSDSTRVNDVETKVDHYARAGVPHYVIADMSEVDEKRRLTMIAYRLVGGAYQPAALDGEGRAWLEPAGLWLGVRIDPLTGGHRVALFDPATQEELGDYTAVRRSRDAADEAARQAAETAREAMEQARLAEEQARLAGEQAWMAGEQARLAEEQARLAEERAEVEALARASLEAELRELRAELGRRGGSAPS